MAFVDDLAAAMDASGIDVCLSNDSVDGEEWKSLLIKRADDQVTLPCRTFKPDHTSPVELMQAAFIAVQHFEECDDFLEWAEIYGLDDGDEKVLDEFRAFEAAQWQLQDLIGHDEFRRLMTGMFIEQAIGAAWAGVAQDQSK
ncbi:MAG: hypothetical protein CMM52_03410 [Rhodospirillaceae bacterium]|mgnify:CR=1 FL=1|nr:hypothetical protein [Rhodospirillaceae bacterium]|tara:strand:+ start:4431 stop:4856 length:426 start_codon:yes stop_codon:yes gene_type:complete